MSRNRSSTTCECTLWSFQTEREIPIDDPDLLTESAYFDAIELPADHGWRQGNRWTLDGREMGGPQWGWGYRADSEGPVYMYVKPGTPVDHRGMASWRHDEYTEAVLVAEYDRVPEEDRYRFRKLQCAICKVLFAGWYVRLPQKLDEPKTYMLYDTSYFYAFNDEPDEMDLREKREWSPEKLAALARRWNETES